MKKVFTLLLCFTGLASAQALCSVANPFAGFVCPADGSTGVTAADYVKWSAGGTALVLGATTDSAAVVVGVADVTQTSGNVLIHGPGPMKPNFDGATTAGHCFTVSSTTAGQFHDQATATCTSASLGVVTQTIGSTGQATAWYWGAQAGPQRPALAYVYQTCDIPVGDTSGSAIVTAQMGPQSRICFIPAASTIVEMDVNADAGTPSIIVGRNRAGTIVNIVSGALATAASGGIACSNTGGTTGLNGVTTCSSTLQNTGLNAGDYLELVSGTPGGTAKFVVVHVILTVN